MLHLGGGDLADGVVVGVRDIDNAVRIHHETVGIVKPRRGFGAVSAAQAACGVAGKGRHHPGGRDHADGAAVRDIHIAAGIHGKACGIGKLRRRIACSTAVEAALHARRSGESAYRSSGRDLADSEVIGIRYIDIATCIHRNARGGVKRCQDTRGVGVASATSGASGKRGHHPAGRDLADGVVVGVGDIHVAVLIQRNAVGMVEAGARALAIGAARPPVSSEGAHHSGGRDHADGVVGGIRDIDIPVRIGGDARGIVEFRRTAHAVN